MFLEISLAIHLYLLCLVWMLNTLISKHEQPCLMTEDQTVS